MRAHLVQLDIEWENRPANFESVGELLGRTDISPGDLVVLPEMFDSGFSLDIEHTNDADGTTLGFLQELAKELGVWIQGGRTVLEAGHDRATNRSPVIDPAGRLVCEYKKIHPFSFGREGERFSGGRDVVVWNMQHNDASDQTIASACSAAPPLVLAPSICYDLRFPELFRIQALRGSECLCLGANWPDARQHHWRTLAIARAIENQSYMLAVNRTGSDPHLSYVGGTIAVGPKGDVLGELGDEQGVLSVEINPNRVRGWRSAFRALEDARLITAEQSLD